MRIAYLINSLEGGGAQSPLPGIITALQRGGADVSLFALARKDGRAERALNAAGISAEVFTGSLANHIGAYGWAKTAIAKDRPDALITSLTRATLLGQLVGESLGVPVASWQHSADAKPWNRRLLNWRSRASQFWIADSRSVANYIEHSFAVDPQDIAVWPLFEADPNAPHSQSRRRSEPIRIGTMGRLHASKGYDVLIDALRRVEQQENLPPFTVSVAGDGPDRERLRQRAADAGIGSFELLGFVNKPAHYLASLHLYIQPSRREGFCIAMHQAMQAGLPIIASDVGEMPCTLENPRHGRIVRAGNAAELASAIIDCLRHEADLARMGEAARATVLQKFPPDTFDASAAEIVRRLTHAAAR